MGDVPDGASSGTALDEALARVRDAACEPMGILPEEAEALPPGDGVSNLLLDDRRAREY